MLCRNYRSVRSRYCCCTELTKVSGTGMKVCTGTGGAGVHIVPNLRKCPLLVLMSCRTYRSVQYRYESLYRFRRYRYPCRTELTEVSGTGIDVVPNLPRCPVPVLMSYRTCRGVRYRHRCLTELTEVSVPVLVSYRTYRSVRYRCLCRYELTEVCSTGIDVPNLPKCPIAVLRMSYRTYRSVRYRYGCRTQLTEVSGAGNTRMTRYLT